MSDNSRGKHTLAQSWLERLSAALLREPQDREQLVNLLRDAEQRDLLDAEALAMIEGVLQISEMHARDVMIPRSQVVVVKESQKLAEFLPFVIASSHSRFPVIGENRDEVIGILHAKDLVKFAHAPKKFTLRDILRPAVYVPESKRLDILLQEFRVNRNHMAVVVDEYGGVAGIVTIEDVLEQIVGEIEDEFDVEEDAYIKKHSETKFIIKALTPIEEFNEYFSADIGAEGFDTIGGLISHAFGRMPKRGEAVTIKNYQFKVINADKRRIHLVQAKLLEPIL